MVGIAQLVEHLVVVQDVAGSSPVVHPKQHATSYASVSTTFDTYDVRVPTRRVGRTRPVSGITVDDLAERFFHVDGRRNVEGRTVRDYRREYDNQPAPRSPTRRLVRRSTC